MARTYVWSRHYGTATPFASGRLAVVGNRLAVPAGGATFERGIISFHLVATDAEPGPVFRSWSNITGGAVLWSSSSSPDLSPDSSPGSDWKWAGGFSLKVLPMFGYTTDAIVIYYDQGDRELDFTTRQTFAAGASVGLTFCVSDPGPFSDGTRPWSLSVYSSALWSFPG